MYDKDDMSDMALSRCEESRLCLGLGPHVVDTVASTGNEVTIDVARVTLNDEQTGSPRVFIPYKQWAWKMAETSNTLTHVIIQLNSERQIKCQLICLHTPYSNYTSIRGVARNLAMGGKNFRQETTPTN